MSVPLQPLSWYRKLNTKKGRLAAGAFIVEGDRAIRQIMAVSPDDIIEILSVEEAPPAYRDYAVRRLTGSQFLYVSSTRTPQGVLAVVRQPEGIYSSRLPGEPGARILLLEDVQDPGNAGTLIRTAAAFGFAGVILTEGCADPLSPKCVQATAGTVLSVWLRRTAYYLDIVSALREGGYALVAAELNGAHGPSVLERQRLVLALGNEAAGLSGKLLGLADYRLRIPTIREKAESLNVAACGAVCMYLASRTG